MKEWNDSNKIYKNLSKLIDLTKGNLILDFYSYYFFDEIIKIENIKENIFKLYWKNNDIIEHDKDIFKFDYIYSIVKIDKIKVFDELESFKIYIKANLLKKWEIRKILNLNNSYRIYSDKCNLFSEVEFKDKVGKKHSCIISDMPFFSMRISLKGSTFSPEEMYYLNKIEIEERLNRIDSKIKTIDKNDEDEIEEKINTVRKLMERILKLYIIMNEYYDGDAIKENDYNNLQLSDLIKTVERNDKNIQFNHYMRRLANKFSHDSGERTSLYDLEKIKEYTEELFLYVSENIEKNNLI